MPDVGMGPRELLAAADRLTGVHPGMGHGEIRAAQDVATLARQWVRYLLDEYKQTADSARRAELVTGMALRARKNAGLKALIRRELAGRIPSTSRRLARNRVRTALERGELIRPVICAGCGRPGDNLQAHHEDYAQPLVVRWLCEPCHLREHGKAGGVLARRRRIGRPRTHGSDVVRKREWARAYRARKRGQA